MWRDVKRNTARILHKHSRTSSEYFTSIPEHPPNTSQSFPNTSWILHTHSRTPPEYFTIISKHLPDTSQACPNHFRILHKHSRPTVDYSFAIIIYISNWNQWLFEKIASIFFEIPQNARIQPETSPFPNRKGIPKNAVLTRVCVTFAFGAFVPMQISKKKAHTHRDPSRLGWQCHLKIAGQQKNNIFVIII